ncbi:hypothetical protein ACH5Y9_12760 [Methylomonas sp. BW4-1]|uniref:hypothetical protein n=1 Tax=Methylomonas sp. BW4-1 TaxID=3376685 RepID=UPI004042D2C1
MSLSNRKIIRHSARWLLHLTALPILTISLTTKPAFAGDMDKYYFCTPLGLKVMAKEVDEYYRGLGPKFVPYPKINFITDKFVNISCDFDDQVKVMKEFGFQVENIDRGPNKIALELPMFKEDSFQIFRPSLELIIEHDGKKIIRGCCHFETIALKSNGSASLIDFSIRRQVSYAATNVYGCILE